MVEETAFSSQHLKEKFSSCSQPSYSKCDGRILPGLARVRCLVRGLLTADGRREAVPDTPVATTPWWAIFLDSHRRTLS